MFNTAIALALSLIHANYEVQLPKTDPVVIYIHTNMKSNHIHSQDTYGFPFVYLRTNEKEYASSKLKSNT